ncbi:hypothetical protein [Micromonospora sp. NPDC048839]|uniref:hypothetical protein n=1 Tax=Micromonospora sp. NPDC048839 TaxID=3155641 RepID=UPI0033E4F4DF
MAWVVAPNIKALFASINKIAPKRDRTTDGTVGDLAHSTGTSGHNPDDTPGVKAERQDADSIPEVRAGDVDRDLRIDHIPGDDMEAVVQKVVRTPALRRRLIYVIYNRRIWSASSDWAQRPYTGSNPHDHHAHFSGDPAYDNDSSPWAGIEQMGEVAELTPEERNWLEKAAKMADQLLNPDLGMKVGGTPTALHQVLRHMAWPIVNGPDRSGAYFAAWMGKVADEVGVDAGELAAIAAAAREGASDAATAAMAALTPAAIADEVVKALPADQAKALVDELTRRLAS